MLSIRKLTLKDKNRVMEICKDIWDGDDYMHLVFNDWINDKSGEFVAAVDEKDKIIGFEKLTMFTPHDAWIEGLRKDQKSSIRGVGKFITDYFLHKLAINKDIKTIRFCTYFDNRESIKLFSKIGFNVLEKRNHKFYRLPQIGYIPKYKTNIADVETDIKKIIEYFHKSEPTKFLRNGICLSWVVKQSTDQLIIDEFISKNQCISIKKGDKIEALCFYTIREKEDLFISFFAANNQKTALNLFQKIKQIAYQNKQEYLKIIIPVTDTNSYNLFKNFGFKSWEQEEDFLLFDYPIESLR